MKSNIIISVLLVILSLTVASCSNEENIIENSLGDELNSENNKIVTFSGATMDGVSVLIFGRNNTSYKYQGIVDTGWSTDGKATKVLEIGRYKFLFMKYTPVYTELYPTTIDQNTLFEDIRIDSKPDLANSGYTLPVDEIWLPETDSLANIIYPIYNTTTVHNKLKRAVSQIELYIIRASNNGTQMDSLPFPTGKNIMDNIQEIKLDIDGVGKYITTAGGFGSEKTLYKATTADSITSKGYAIFEGPLLFPNGTRTNTSVDITITTKTGSAYPATMTEKVQGLLERNKKLKITLWLTSTYEFITITVDTEPISENTDGDSGIWE